MFPEEFFSKVFRATIVGGIGTIIGAIFGGIVFGILAAIVVAGLGAIFQSPSYGSYNEISAILASLSGFGGALWGAGIGGAAGLLTGILLVVLDPVTPAPTVHIPAPQTDFNTPASGSSRPSKRHSSTSKGRDSVSGGWNYNR